MSKEPYIEVVQSRIEMRMNNHPLTDKYPGPITIVYGSNIKEQKSYPLEFTTQSGETIATEDEEVLSKLFHAIMGDSPEELLG